MPTPEEVTEATDKAVHRAQVEALTEAVKRVSAFRDYAKEASFLGLIAERAVENTFETGTGKDKIKMLKNKSASVYDGSVELLQELRTELELLS